MIKRTLMLFAFLALMPSAAFAVITVHTTDFIPDGTRTNFNGFEATRCVLASPLKGEETSLCGGYALTHSHLHAFTLLL